MATTSKLVLLRHGQSTWNELNQFTGWVDVPLTDQGRIEAARAGELLKEENILPDVVYTSLLRRAITTANLALEAADRQWIPTQRSWRLNERHYGALQGLNKAQIREEHGEEKFMSWRRSYDTPPPMLDDDHEYSQYRDERYALLGEDIPRTECLKDVVTRLIPYWYDNIVPELAQGKTVLIVAHGNSLRALVKHLEGIPMTTSQSSTCQPVSHSYTSWTRKSNPSAKHASWTRQPPPQVPQPLPPKANNLTSRV